MKKLLTNIVLLLFALPFMVNAQMISGTVMDGLEPVIGATVKVGTTGTVTDSDGKYAVKVAPGTHMVEVSYIGYGTQKLEVNVADGEKTTWDVALIEGLDMAEVTILGSRTPPRSNTNSPLPIDVVGAKELLSTGQNSFDKALTYRVPSFNSVNTPVNDATSLLDPYEIRNMGPSRTLVLIDGKRKNSSALLYTQTSPGRGESGTDISAIPQDAIERVEILRDGASAQYGSDAIAGVMNIILKKDAQNGSITFTGGITAEGDGETFGVALNNGAKIGEKGFVNYTVDFSKRELANRPGMVSAEGEAADFGADLGVVQEFLGRNPDANNINGSPETTAAKFAVNMGYDISDNTELYGNAAYVYKKVNSFANYRTPYWRTIEDLPYLGNFFPGENPNNIGKYTDELGYTFDGNGYDGYVPTFDGDLGDYNGTIGLRSVKNDWIADASFTVGGNEQTYLVRNSHNRSTIELPLTLSEEGDTIRSYQYRQNSPLVFDVGGTRFTHVVGNIDINKRFTDMVGIGFGSEFRSENFTVIPGSEASYDGLGPDSFAGNELRNSGTFNRYNFGGYLALALDLTDDFLIDGTVRLENYSDFGSAFVWKVSSRYKFLEDKITLRASASTGFRAPSLHQIYTQKTQYSFVPGQGIQVGGLVNNISREAKLLGLPQLDAEKSTNITVGLGIRPNYNWSFTLDYYNIAVKDRIILSTEITCEEGDDNPLCDLLVENGIVDLSFFVNALDTRTSGIDFVAGYKGLTVGTGTMNFNLSGNYTIQNEREGEVKDPQIVKDAEQTVSNPTQEGLFFTSRPQYKAIFGIDYSIGKFGVSLNNTLFGPTQFRQQGLSDPGLYTEFAPKVVTDLGLNYQITEKVSAILNVNNVLNVLPEWSFKTDAGVALPSDEQLFIDSNAITFNQRYPQMTYNGYHFSQLGTIFNLVVRVKL